MNDQAKMGMTWASSMQQARNSTVEKPQREWVGLTDEEIDQGLLHTKYAMETAGSWREGVEWATKQLREKNETNK